VFIGTVAGGSDTGDGDSRAANAMPRVWMMPAAASRLKVMGLLSSGSDNGLWWFLATESYLEAEQERQMQGIQVSEWNKKTES
jgi:hypothetical protein